MPSADDVVITTPGGRPLDTAALFRHATAHAPTLTGYVLGRLLFDIEQNQSQLAKFAEAVRSLRDALTNNEGDVEG